MQAQIGSLGKKILERAEKNPVENLLKATPPITTSFADVDTTGMLPPTFGKDSVFKPLTDLKRTEDGDFILEPGFYRLQVKSYCLHAGTHGPSSGYGYMYAPVEGPKADIVIAVVQNSYHHPEIPQHDIQVLLWAIVDRCKFGNLAPNIKLTATSLLTPEQILQLQGGAVGVIPDAVLQKGISSLPPEMRKLMQAENDLRRKLNDANSSYEEMERVAVLAGMEPDNGGMHIESGVWSFHPNGYYIRYIPSGYSSTLLQVWVPEMVIYSLNGKKIVVPWDREPPQGVEMRSLRNQLLPKQFPPKWDPDRYSPSHYNPSHYGPPFWEQVAFRRMLMSVGPGNVEKWHGNFSHVGMAEPANTGNQRLIISLSGRD